MVTLGFVWLAAIAPLGLLAGYVVPGLRDR